MAFCRTTSSQFSGNGDTAYCANFANHVPLMPFYGAPENSNRVVQRLYRLDSKLISTVCLHICMSPGDHLQWSSKGSEHPVVFVLEAQFAFDSVAHGASAPTRSTPKHRSATCSHINTTGPMHTGTANLIVHCSDAPRRSRPES